MSDPPVRLAQAGVSIWLDELDRTRLTSGSPQRLVARRHVVGMTTNPTIFTKAMTGSDAHDPQIRELTLRGVEVNEALRALTTYDVRAACDLLCGGYDTTAGVDGRVSIEVDPRTAHDTERTVAATKALWWLVDRPNLLIKIPPVHQGIPAISACLTEGINITLIFSLTRYATVSEAFLTGMHRARENGHDPTRTASVASFFVSRLDTEIDARLDAIATPAADALPWPQSPTTTRSGSTASAAPTPTPGRTRRARGGQRRPRPRRRGGEVCHELG